MIPLLTEEVKMRIFKDVDGPLLYSCGSKVYGDLLNLRDAKWNNSSRYGRVEVSLYSERESDRRAFMEYMAIRGHWDEMLWIHEHERITSAKALGAVMICGRKDIIEKVIGYYDKIQVINAFKYIHGHLLQTMNLDILKTTKLFFFFDRVSNKEAIKKLFYFLHRIFYFEVEDLAPISLLDYKLFDVENLGKPLLFDPFEEFNEETCRRVAQHFVLSACYVGNLEMLKIICDLILIYVWGWIETEPTIDKNLVYLKGLLTKYEKLKDIDWIHFKLIWGLKLAIQLNRLEVAKFLDRLDLEYSERNMKKLVPHTQTWNWLFK